MICKFFLFKSNGLEAKGFSTKNRLCFNRPKSDFDFTWPARDMLADCADFNSGWCVSTVESALWALNTTGTFEDALIAAVNLGGDADSIGAVCGQLAGAKYGLSAIPERWLHAIKDHGRVDALFQKFLAALGIENI
ncbi:MAG: ADP-ribosylglycohydrolase family protein [Kiritimatiellae bacterium]|nr:ADP-ribosylglycohydrolase family protein [Kiritimatiellia bacterium]